MRPLLALIVAVILAIGLTALLSGRHQSEPTLVEKYALEDKQKAEEALKQQKELEAKSKDPARLAAFDKVKDQAIRATLEIENRGTIVMEFYPKAAPKTVAHLVSLCKQNFYNGIFFHRKEEFVVQAGDPTTKTIDNKLSEQELKIKHPNIGTNGSGKTVPLEAGMPHLPMTVGLARSAERDSGDSQFYINLKDNFYLDPDYCVFGRVVQGEEVVKSIQLGDRIKSFTVAP